MNDLPLIHWGVQGMRWGVRRARRAISKAFSPKTTTKLQKGKDGKTYLVTRTSENNHLVNSLNRKNRVLKRKEVTPKQAQAFLNGVKKQKIKDIERAAKAKKAGQIVGRLLTIYGVYKTVNLIGEMESSSAPTYSPAYAEWLKNG